MPLTAPEAILFESILKHIAQAVPEVRYINQDMGQLENYELRPAVSWPCVLIDMDDFDFSEAGNPLIQIGEGFVQVRIGLVQYSQSDNLVPDNIRANSLKYMDVADKVNKALHGWAPAGFSRLLRRKAVTEKRDDDIRVKILRYAVSYKENLSVATTVRLTPEPVIGTAITR